MSAKWVSILSTSLLCPLPPLLLPSATISCSPSHWPFTNIDSAWHPRLFPFFPFSSCTFGPLCVLKAVSLTSCQPSFFYYPTGLSSPGWSSPWSPGLIWGMIKRGIKLELHSIHPSVHYLRYLLCGCFTALLGSTVSYPSAHRVEAGNISLSHSHLGAI